MGSELPLLRFDSWFYYIVTLRHFQPHYPLAAHLLRRVNNFVYLEGLLYQMH